MTDQEKVFFELIVKKHTPKAKVKNKSSSLFFRVLGKIIGLFNKRFNEFWSTIGYTIYRPDNKYEQLHTLLHEGYHCLQAKRRGKLRFSLSYLMPQLLSLVALFVFIPGSSSLFLLFLLFLLPVKSVGRKKIEMEAYKVSIAVIVWTTGRSSNMTNSSIDNFVDHFVGSSYYWMSSDRVQIKSEIVKAVNLAYNLDQEFMSDIYIKDTYELLHNLNMTHEDGISVEMKDYHKRLMERSGRSKL